MKRNYAILNLTAVAALCAASANAAAECFDFSNMAEDASYTVGDVINTRLATITVRPYVVNGEPVTADVRRAGRVQSQIAGGAAPELEMKLVALTIEPNQPVKRITARIAQNISSTGGFADSGVGINRKGLKSQTGFAGFDGKVLGNAKTGKAKISANISPSGSGNWHTGTLEFNAVKGHIEILRLGGNTVRLDDVCVGP